MLHISHFTNTTNILAILIMAFCLCSSIENDDFKGQMIYFYIGILAVMTHFYHFKIHILTHTRCIKYSIAAGLCAIICAIISEIISGSSEEQKVQKKRVKKTQNTNEMHIKEKINLAYTQEKEDDFYFLF